MSELTPREIVEELDRYIVGQKRAKRAVAIALRNRIRRRRLPADLRDEVVPKNILMIGPTGVGKTEIARRLAKLAQAPFIKVEATKFTEVGYVGRDVESIVRDIVETAIRMVKSERIQGVMDRAGKLAEERLLDVLAPVPHRERQNNPFSAFFGLPQEREGRDGEFEERVERARGERDHLLTLLRTGQLEERVVEIEVEDQTPPMLELLGGGGVEEMGVNLSEILGGVIPRKRRRRKVSVSEARRILAQEEAQKLIDMDEVTAEAVSRAENGGIIFLDEIDKIAGKESGAGPDVSREGVQRDILPIVEGSTVMTKYGPVRTDHMLFIAAGAFHVSKPSDLIPELQGRFPIRVELDSLLESDFVRILTEPENALTRQYSALLGSDGVELEFSPGGVSAIARAAHAVNERTENIGARRLHTIMERLLEEVSFDAPGEAPRKVVVDEAFVESRLSDILQNVDLSRYIL